MALKAGYKGIKNNLVNKLKVLPFISSIGDGLSLEDGELSATGGGGGTTVVANPEGEASADLTKLKVDSTIYGIPEAVDVEANPSGTATTDLTKLKVDSTIYGIPAQPDITGKADITAIGTNETGTTASRAYAVGEHFYKGGKFCTAIAAIAQGATFTLNTNYLESTIADIVLPYKASELSYAGIQSNRCSVDDGGWVIKGNRCYVDILIRMLVDIGSDGVSTFPALSNLSLFISNTLPVPKDTAVVTATGILMKYSTTSRQYTGPLKFVNAVVSKSGTEDVGVLAVAFFDTLTIGDDQYDIKLKFDYVIE